MSPLGSSTGLFNDPHKSDLLEVLESDEMLFVAGQCEGPLGGLLGVALGGLLGGPLGGLLGGPLGGLLGGRRGTFLTPLCLSLLLPPLVPFREGPLAT